METKIISTAENPEAGTLEGAAIIREGGLVVFPTETVYGLGANGLDGEAVNRIFKAKGRPNDNPLILHVADKEGVKPLWREVPPAAEKLMGTFWPGPLTMIYYRSDAVPQEVTAGLDTVAVRLPENQTARALIEKAGVPIAAPSANLSGKPSPTTAAHVYTDMNGRVPLILDGGPCRFGVESTVVSLTCTPTVLRPGAVTKEMLEAVVGEVKLADCLLKPLKEGEKVLSPGMKYRHYAPDARVIVITGEPGKAAERILTLYDTLTAEGKRCEIAATKQTAPYYGGRRYTLLGDRNDPITLCQTLFYELREMDGRADVILAEGVSAEGAGLAYMNRLLRSAGFETETV